MKAHAQGATDQDDIAGFPVMMELDLDEEGFEDDVLFFLDLEIE